MRGDRHQAVAPAAGKDWRAPEGHPSEPLESSFGRHRHDAWPVALDLLGEPLDVFTSRQPDDPELVGIRIDHREGALTESTRSSREWRGISSVILKLRATSNSYKYLSTM